MNDVYVILVQEGTETSVYSVYRNQFDANNEAAQLRSTGEYLRVDVIEAELE